ncbi:putative two component, sigma54 specific, transcriptional regulator, Fis family [Desulfarculus baarsii DSM 2075]|uniref:Two component, sigma54 specific, transcriptional regulator, Fis family n=1 Tax=Desulfarculus baarsii (strain ATCC 33931 / DSM 2075 / LMG 7858 / VKM B-1802 / 2st14) TaxID=644282 RepID=E1QG80_DESB2|nr:sigma-54 dependent transcriptional regulator [Desulfarculus baarsii]ADK83592.1 putative two component, sigma54 specific, transcriptional regulator, Fis family [Desulfarculus baarsii DSM 2075]
MKTVLVGTNDKNAQASIHACLSAVYSVAVTDTGPACLEAIGKRAFDIYFIDIDFIRQCLPPENQRDFAAGLRHFRNGHRNVPVVILAPPEAIRQAVEAVKAGAEDYLIYPVDVHEVELVLDNLRQSHKIQAELQFLRDSFWRVESRDLVRTRSPLMKAVYERIESVASTKATVLLTGETGTGKSLIAKLIHSHSKRGSGPFISVHCGAIPENLVESELFGHEKGSFTGAERRKLGKFELADRGTIFLDEIGTVSPNAQIKLLQVLQDGTFSRVGGERTIAVDVRVVAASNVNLQELMEAGAFRGDLFYRLNVFQIELPPLRQRREDVGILARTFLERLNAEYGKNIGAIDATVMEALRNYAWPGNIRELENLLERAYILEKTDTLCATSFPADLLALSSPAPGEEEAFELRLAEARQRAVNEVEQRYLIKQLTQKKGRVDRCAAQAGVTTRQYRYLMAKYGLRAKDFR